MLNAVPKDLGSIALVAYVATANDLGQTPLFEVDPASGRPSQPPMLPGWDAYPVGEQIAEAIGKRRSRNPDVREAVVEIERHGILIARRQQLEVIGAHVAGEALARGVHPDRCGAVHVEHVGERHRIVQHAILQLRDDQQVCSACPAGAMRRDRHIELERTNCLQRRGKTLRALSRAR